MKHLIYISLAISLLMVIGCRGGGKHAAELVGVDSLLARGCDRIALDSLKALDTRDYNEADNAYYGLLLTQAHHNNEIADTVDTLIAAAAHYFHDSGDKEKYMRAMLYLGWVNENAGHLEKAIECYHVAEGEGDDQSEALKLNSAFAKMRLGFLYKEQKFTTRNQSIDKFREALSLFRALGNKPKEAMCMGEMGTLYRSAPNKLDSAEMLLKDAVKLAREQGDNRLLSTYLYSLAEFHCLFTHKYDLAKRYSVEALQHGQGVIGHPRVHCCAALSYMHLNDIDSARYYIKQAPQPVDSTDIMWYYKTMGDVEQAGGRADVAQRLHKLSHTFADTIMVRGFNNRLLEVESRYDRKEKELLNKELQASLNRTLLILACVVIAVLLLVILVIRYRSRLRAKQMEYEAVTADLTASLHSLEEMKRIAAAEQSDDLKDIIEGQIKSIQKLIEWSYECTEQQFARKFNTMISSGSADDNTAFWKGLHAIANGVHGNILERAQQVAGGNLRDDEVNYLALYSCGFSRTAMMICLGYKSLGTISNKRSQIAHKLGVNTLEEFMK